MTSSAIGKRIKQHLQASSLCAGESNHRFRRGHTQSDAAAGFRTTSDWGARSDQHRSYCGDVQKPHQALAQGGAAKASFACMSNFSVAAL